MWKYLFRVLVLIIWLIGTLLFVLVGLVENTITIFTGKETSYYSNKWSTVYMPILGHLNVFAQIELYQPQGESDVSTTN